MKNTAKGFTLIELLVVLAIVAILSVVVILTLNPAELLRQSRDSNRLSDLNTMKSAISLYLADVGTPVLYWPSDTSYTKCSVSLVSAAVTMTTSSKCGAFSSSGSITQPPASTTVAAYRKVDSTGWIPVNFTNISSGAPIGNLPIDPLNNGTYYYSYMSSSSLTFELDAFLESSKYASYASNDGGDSSTTYEVGTAPGLSL